MPHMGFLFSLLAQMLLLSTSRRSIVGSAVRCADDC